MIAVRFGASTNRRYTFPVYENRIDARSQNVSASSQQLPGASGGFPGLGFGPKPLQPKTFTVNFTIRVEQRRLMTPQLDAVNAIAGWGVQRLYVIDDAGEERWINCEVQRIQNAQNVNTHSDLHQPVAITFIAHDPHWYKQGTENPIWGGGSLWGGGAVWGGASVPQVCTGLQTDFTVTHNGTGFARPRIFITVADGDTASDIRVQRIVGGSVVDQVRYTGALSPSGGDNVVKIDCRALTATLDNADIFSSTLWGIPTNLWWFRLPEGDNSIRVLMTNSGDECTVEMKYYDTYI